MAFERDLALVRLQQAGDHVEGRRLAGAVGPEQADRLALAHVQRHAVDDAAPLEALAEVPGGQRFRIGDGPRFPPLRIGLRLGSLFQLGSGPWTGTRLSG